jgi:hypothetical protein
MKILRQFLNDNDLLEALDHAPPGIIDSRSWAYWNSKLDGIPPARHAEASIGLRINTTAHSQKRNVTTKNLLALSNVRTYLIDHI